MVNSNKKALGIIFPNSYDNWVPELVNVRLMSSIPFASRYRMVDFVLSSMANSGIDNISVIVKKNYHSLMDHLGSGREWDLVRKHGGLNIFPPFMESDSRAYLGKWLYEEEEDEVPEIKRSGGEDNEENIQRVSAE